MAKDPLLPKIPHSLQLGEIDYLKDEQHLFQLELKDENWVGLDTSQVYFQQTLLNKCLFSGSHFTRFECMDVIFNHCDLSNVEWIGGSFHRIIFKNCKLTGCNFAESTLRDCQFIDCMMDYCSFNYTTMKSVSFQENSLKDSEFSEVTWQHLFFYKNKLTGSTWFQTKLAGLNFSTCTFEQIILSKELLRGLTVNQEQAITIALGFGLLLDEPLSE
ncbi:pentapeptide repeat-containing protein [Vagococcus entomophilus]|uniref:Quinolone resistance protein n=1 Tax=Vagococcus entomophilus TaxID=1160095 RepID=A0A430AFN9_9ENTE|nr:pentapeptide repeat-containing protein [Vagococcus entomophilus]RSU06542.1 hypothetical protein CBF30_09855 [Vagococcus entomophilus]